MKIESMDAKIVQSNQNVVKQKVKAEPAKSIQSDEVKIDKVDKIDKIDKHYVGAVKLSEYEKNELPASEKAIIAAIEKANKAITGSNRKFEFSIHDKTKSIMIKVIDTENDEVIRELPSENILDMVAKMWELAGLAFDKKG